MSLKRALLVGINYNNVPKYKLYGAINDVNTLQTYLVNGNYFAPSEIITMTDNSIGSLLPTKQNILAQLDSLVVLALANPASTITFFFSFSGHGGSIKDCNVLLNASEGNEHFVDVLYPLDVLTSGYITDVELKTEFINKLPANVKLSALIDTCCSGTMFNLKYNYAVNPLNVYTIYGDMFQTNADVLLLTAAKDNHNAVEAVIGSNCNKTNNRAVFYKPSNCGEYDDCGGCGGGCCCRPSRINEEVPSCRSYLAINTCAPNQRKSKCGCGKKCGGRCKKRCNASAVEVIYERPNCCNNNNIGCGCNVNNNCVNPTQFYQGVLTAAFVANYSDFLSYYDLVANIRAWTAARNYKQQAQFSSGKFLNVKTTKKFFA